MDLVVAIAGLMPDAELVILDGAGRRPTLERPAAVNAALRRLLADRA
jgi:pimeloyl-ACP methyl ester carboxylesterase